MLLDIHKSHYYCLHLLCWNAVLATTSRQHCALVLLRRVLEHVRIVLCSSTSLLVAVVSAHNTCLPAKYWSTAVLLTQGNFLLCSSAFVRIYIAQLMQTNQGTHHLPAKCCIGQHCIFPQVDALYLPSEEYVRLMPKQLQVAGAVASRQYRIDTNLPARTTT